MLLFLVSGEEAKRSGGWFPNADEEGGLHIIFDDDT